MPTERITREDLAVAMENGALRFDVADDGDPTCLIGDYEPFYIACSSFDEDGRHHLATTPTTTLLDEAVATIEQMAADLGEDFADEHAYYASVIQDCYLDLARNAGTTTERGAALIRQATRFEDELREALGAAFESVEETLRAGDEPSSEEVNEMFHELLHGKETSSHEEYER